MEPLEIQIVILAMITLTTLMIVSIIHVMGQITVDLDLMLRLCVANVEVEKQHVPIQMVY